MAGPELPTTTSESPGPGHTGEIISSFIDSFIDNRKEERASKTKKNKKNSLLSYLFENKEVGNFESLLKSIGIPDNVIKTIQKLVSGKGPAEKNNIVNRLQSEIQDKDFDVDEFLDNLKKRNAQQFEEVRNEAKRKAEIGVSGIKDLNPDQKAETIYELQRKYFRAKRLAELAEETDTIPQIDILDKDEKITDENFVSIANRVADIEETLDEKILPKLSTLEKKADRNNPQNRRLIVARTILEEETGRNKTDNKNRMTADAFATGKIVMKDESGKPIGFKNYENEEQRKTSDSRHMLSRVSKLTSTTKEISEPVKQAEIIVDQEFRFQEASEILENFEEVRESFLKTEPKLRFEMAYGEFEAEIKIRAGNPENPGNEVMTEQEINNIIKKYFPYDSKLAVEAALAKSKGNGKEQISAIEKYTLEREIAKRTLVEAQKRIIKNREGYIKNRESRKKEIMQTLASRKEGNTTQVDNASDNTTLFTTQNGDNILVFTKAEDYYNVVRPEITLKKEQFGIKPGNLNEQETVEFLNGVLTSQEGNNTFQAAIGTDDDAVIAILVPEIPKEIQGQDDQLTNEHLGIAQELGIVVTGQETQKDLAFILAISKDALIHESQHTSDMVKRKIAKEIIQELNGSKREAAEKILKESTSQILNDRTRRAIWETSAVLLENEIYERGNHELSLADIAVYQPGTAEGFDAELVEDLEKTDGKLQEMLTLINYAIENDKDTVERIVSIFKEEGGIDPGQLAFYENLNPADRKKILRGMIINHLSTDSYMEDENPLELAIQNLRKMTGLQDSEEFKDLKPDYTEEEETSGVHRWGIVSRDINILFRDGPALINQYSMFNELDPPRDDIVGHSMVPMHQIGPVRWLNAELKWRLFDDYRNTFSKDGYYPEDVAKRRFMQQVMNSPVEIVNKDMGFLGLITNEVVGGYRRRLGVLGRTDNDLRGMISYNIDQNGRITDAAGNVVTRRNGLAPAVDNGNAYSVSPWIRGTAGLPWINQVLSRYNSASWGDATWKIFGRGPLATRISQFVTGVAKNDNIDFSSPPRWSYRYGYTQDDIARGLGPNDPDGMLRTIMHREGNMTPMFDPISGRWTSVENIAVEAVIPSMDFNRQASISTLLALVSKGGINERDLRAMLMQYLPELNIRQAGALPDFDMTQFTNVLRETDLDYKQRVSKNIMSNSSFINDVKVKIFGSANFDGEVMAIDNANINNILGDPFDVTEDGNFSDYDFELDYDGSRLAGGPVRTRPLFANAANPNAEFLGTNNIIRGHISSEYVEKMKQRC
ncbi:MAG TPA: hypothetical protein VGA67_04260, partial [Candidatus Dojkabacteria bacterium]